MFDIIKKDEYFQCLDEDHGSRKDHSLKGIQDAWVLRQLHDVSGKKIMEVGGGNSRVLPKLQDNKLWNAEKFEGVGHGPVKKIEQAGVRIFPAFMGEFNPDAPEVDIIFSISVIEHIPFDRYDAAFEDMARCLAPGGTMFHAIDLPLADEPLETAQKRISGLIKAVERAGLNWREPPVLKKDAVFRSDMASNSDLTMWQWANISEASRITGPKAQIVSIKLIADKSV